MATMQRVNILSDFTVRDQFIHGVNLLKAEDSGRTTQQFGIPGPSVPISTYDTFVIWHHNTMSTLTPPGNPAGRNAAHMGPIFLPWHRVMLLLFEENLRRVLVDPHFALPYWDWSADGDLSVAEQKASHIWAENCLGGDGNPVSTGPFRFDASNPTSWRVLFIGVNGQIRQVNRGLIRNLGQQTALPNTIHVAAALALNDYDANPWDGSSSGFRNRLEGWRTGTTTRPPWLHNRVHVWIGGDMGASTSPNDPAFYLNHCNVDRLWEAWMVKHGRTYMPLQTAPEDLRGHRIDDPILSPLGATTTPRSILDVSSLYTYDALPS